MHVVKIKEKVLMVINGSMESDTMRIRCKKSKRFLMEINYDEIIKIIEKHGIALEIPLEIVVPCRACHESEVYRIYEDHYVFVENRKVDK